MLGEAGNATHSSWAEQDTANDFGNDTRLLDLLEGETEGTSNNDDEGGLNDEEPKRIRGLECSGVRATNDAVALGGACREVLQHVC